MSFPRQTTAKELNGTDLASYKKHKKLLATENSDNWKVIFEQNEQQILLW